VSHLPFYLVLEARLQHVLPWKSYRVIKSQMMPNCSFFLSFNLH